MKKLVVTVVAILLSASGAQAQDVTHLYSRPVPPSQEPLDRLDLKTAWRIYVPTEGRRDGIFSVQMLGEHILVQTRSGLVTLLDAGDGSTLWRARVGVPYRVSHELAYNHDSIFAVRGTMLYALDRQNGRLRWEFDLPNVSSAAPAADAERIYLPLGIGRFYVYKLPETKEPKPAEGDKKPEAPASESERAGPSIAAVGPLSAASQAVSARGTGPQPESLWNHQSESRLEQTPLLTDDLVVLGESNGNFYVASKVLRHIPYEFQAAAALSAPLGQYSAVQANGQVVEMAYVPSQDFNVYALDVAKGHIAWHFTGGGPIFRKPAVTDEDLYVSADRAGLYRVNRQTGDQIWRNKDADRFLAMNKKYVYATDRSGRLMVLDRARGLQRALLDTRDFVVPISNEWTDRLFLAANDGLILCLHDREYKTPLSTKTRLEKKAPQAPDAK